MSVLLRTAFGVLVIDRFPLSLGAAELLSRVHPDEAALARSFGERRQRTFAMGRIVARQALSALGTELPAPILKDDRGAPRVPAPLSLSLSHKDEVAAALLSLEGRAHVGVDLEPLSERERARDIAAHVLTEGELAEFAGLDEDTRRREVLVRFALKEALYKALDPWVRRYVGFLEVEARVLGEGDAREARFTLGLPAPEGPFVVTGQLLHVEELAVALVRVAQPS
ncbi:MAG: 4'-phosphopantetheinyl transferase superfamily protein [Deltaproteobacteria bacterium]|nr:4'-phosphopantetheinyl transferase superfamily protein [Deltaproteobacteria bacterium]